MYQGRGRSGKIVTKGVGIAGCKSLLLKRASCVVFGDTHCSAQAALRWKVSGKRLGR